MKQTGSRQIWVLGRSILAYRIRALVSRVQGDCGFEASGARHRLEVGSSGTFLKGEGFSSGLRVL